MEEKKEQDNSSKNAVPKVNESEDKVYKPVYNDGPLHSTKEKALDKKDDKVDDTSSKTTDPIIPLKVEDNISAESKKDSKLDLGKVIKEPSITAGPDTVLKIFSKISQDGATGKKVKEKRFTKDSFLTWIIVAYTVLILILGFVVYWDVSKRLNQIEDRVSQIEAIVLKKTEMGIEDIKLYDMK